MNTREIQRRSIIGQIREKLKKLEGHEYDEKTLIYELASLYGVSYRTAREYFMIAQI